jgi:membrane protein DedA with SNARE-associated domain
MNINKRWLPFAVLGFALILWAAMFAAGSYLEVSADNPRHDIRKPLIILASMATFLALWAVAFWLRARRDRPER